ncbi:MAG: thiol:disulfide interchange protein DsbA/DsbL [Pseudomonadota bacterium]|nr:thiol:disulfide interchange protein DsbA/DsbL [Pseudomonadota bacterium]
MKHPTRSRSFLIFSTLLLSGLLAACNQAPATGEGASADATADAASPSADAMAAAASAAAAEGAETPAEVAAAEPAPIPDPAANAAVAEEAASSLTPGVDYDLIKGGQPYEPLNGKIEVVEVFGYICPACARFEPTFTAWKARAPADVRVTYVAAPFGEQWMPYARAFYVADAMGIVDQSHTALFHAIHLEGSLPREGQKPDEAKVAEFYARYGADPKRFLSDMRSFSTEARIKRGQQFMIRTGVGGTPTLVINGKYRARGRSYQEMMDITDKLIAMERAEMQEGATAP